MTEASATTQHNETSYLNPRDRNRIHEADLTMAAFREQSPLKNQDIKNLENNQNMPAVPEEHEHLATSPKILSPHHITLEEDSPSLPKTEITQKDTRPQNNTRQPKNTSILATLKSRKKEFTLWFGLLLVVVALGLIPVYLRKDKSPVQLTDKGTETGGNGNGGNGNGGNGNGGSGNGGDEVGKEEKPVLLFQRTFKEKQQDTYKIDLQSTLEMGVGDQISKQETNKKYTLTVTTLSLETDNVILNFFLFENVQDPNYPEFADSNGIPQGLDDATNSASDPTFLEEPAEELTSDTLASMNLKFITCNLLMTGKVDSCKKPNYLSLNDYTLILNLADQLSPVLEKKYYDKNRVLPEISSDEAGNPMAGFLENRNFDYTEGADGQVTLGNTYESPSNSDSSLTHAMNTATNIDPTTGVIKSSKQSCSSTMGGAGGADDFMGALKQDYSLTVNLHNSTIATDKVVSFLNAISSVQDALLNVSQPIENRQAATTTPTSTTKQIPDSENPTLEDFKSTFNYVKDSNSGGNIQDANFTGFDDLFGDTGDSLMADSSEDQKRNLAFEWPPIPPIPLRKEVVFDFKKDLFSKQLLGQTISTSLSIQVFDIFIWDQDLCVVKLTNKFFVAEEDLFYTDFQCPLTYVIKTYKYIKQVSLQQAYQLNVNFDKLNSDAKASMQEFDKEVSGVLGSMKASLYLAQSQLLKLQADWNAVEKSQQSLDDYSRLMQNITDKLLTYTLYYTELQYQLTTEDLWLFMSDIRRFHEYTQSESIGKYIAASTYDDILNFLQNFRASFISYLKPQADSLQKPNTVLKNLLDQVQQIIDNISTNSQYQAIVGDLSELEAAKNFFTAQITQNMTSISQMYYEDFLIKLYSQYEVLMSELISLENQTMKVLESRKTSNDTQIDAVFTANLNEFLTSFNTATPSFATSAIDIEITQQSFQKIQDLLSDWIPAYLNVIKAARKTNADSLTTIYDSLHANLTSQYNDVASMNFSSQTTTFLDNINQAFYHANNDFYYPYDAIIRVTGNSFKPDAQDLENGVDIGEKDELDFGKSVDDVFNNVQSSMTKTKNLKDYPWNYKAATSASTFDSYYKGLKDAYNTYVQIRRDFNTKYQITDKIPDYNFTALENITNTARNEVSSELDAAVKAGVTDQVDSIQTKMTQIMATKPLVTNKLKQVLISQGQFGPALPEVVPFGITKSIFGVNMLTPIGDINVGGEYTVNIVINFQFGLEDGGVYFRVIPSISASVTLSGSYGYEGVEVGCDVTGTAFKGQLPTTVLLYVFTGRQARAYADLVNVPAAAAISVWHTWPKCDLSYKCSKVGWGWFKVKVCYPWITCQIVQNTILSWNFNSGVLGYTNRIYDESYTWK